MILIRVAIFIYAFSPFFAIRYFAFAIFHFAFIFSPLPVTLTPLSPSPFSRHFRYGRHFFTISFLLMFIARCY